MELCLYINKLIKAKDTKWDGIMSMSMKFWKIGNIYMMLELKYFQLFHGWKSQWEFNLRYLF